jgi:hypothetical protein
LPAELGTKIKNWEQTSKRFTQFDDLIYCIIASLDIIIIAHIIKMTASCDDRIDCIVLMIFSVVLSGITVWRVYESALPAIQDVKVLQATYPLVVELNQDHFLQTNNNTTNDPTTGNSTVYPLVHMVGYLYTPDQVMDAVFDVSYKNSDVLLLHRDVEVYSYPWKPDNYELQWNSGITEAKCFDSTGRLIQPNMIPFSANSFIAGSIFFGWTYYDDVVTTRKYDTIRLSPDDIPIVNSFLTWDTPLTDQVPVVPVPLSLVTNMTSTVPKYHRIHGIASSTNQFIYRPVSDDTAPYWTCGDVRIAYRAIPVPNTAISVVASLSCNTVASNTNVTETAAASGTNYYNRSCAMRSYSIHDKSTNPQEFGDNVPFHFIERGNYTLHDLYQHAYRTTIRSTARSLALACTIGIAAAFFHVALSWHICPNSIFLIYIRKRPRAVANEKFLVGFCCGVILRLAAVISVASNIYLFSMIWIVHRTALSIMIPLEIVSFIATVFLYGILLIQKSPNEESTRNVWYIREHPTQNRDVTIGTSL